MARQRFQPGERRSLNPRDQWGRKWSMSIEIATGDPTGSVMPAWGALGDPLRTPMTYIKTVKNEEGQVELGKVVVDIDQWIRDIEHAEQIWLRQLIENALLKNVDITDLDEVKRHKILLQLTGPKPWPSADVLRLAKAGDKALLGMEPLTAKERALLGQQTLEDLQAAPTAKKGDENELPPDTYQEFVAWCFKRGVRDLKEVAAQWKTHKELAAA